jgi:hypothetical protein
MPIDKDQLCSDVCSWLPSENQLTESQILSLAEIVISNVGDEEENYAEVRCKTLRACGEMNKQMAVTSTSIRREKSLNREIEFYQGNSKKNWDDWLKSLPTLCANLGYTDLAAKSSYGFYGNISPPVTAFGCCCEEEDARLTL